MPKHYAITCTHCAAPLDILGGGRVNTVTCSYCHSMLDMNDHYKVLAKFNDAKHPKGPFKIGMRGNIKGVEWTIIGWIHYKTGEFPSEAWDEFFLYSPTHGYAWLVYEKSKVYFAKRVRDFDLLTWQEKKPKTLFYHKGHYLQKEAAYLTYVEYVEGELNWVAKFGDKFTTWDYEGVGFQVLNIEKNADELEVYHTERLDKADIYRAFELEYTQESKTHKSMNKKSVYSEQTEENKAIEEKDDTIKQWYLLLFVIILLVNLLSFSMPKQLYNDSMPYTEHNDTFTIDSNAFMTSITLSGQKLGTSDINFSLYQNKKRILAIDKYKVLYTKKDLLYHWYSSSEKVILYLKLNKGKYTFNVKNKDLIYLNIKIKQKVIRLKYLFPLLILLFIAVLFFYLDFILEYIEMAYSLGILSIAGYIIYLSHSPFITVIILFPVLFLIWNSNQDDDLDYDDLDDWSDDD